MVGQETGDRGQESEGPSRREGTAFVPTELPRESSSARSPAASNPGSSENEGAIWTVLNSVLDPELPLVSIVELGIVRGVAYDGSTVRVQLTPTYSGCPAVEVIEADVVRALQHAGFDARVERVLSPAWSSDWMSNSAREKFHASGIAPPPPLGSAQTIHFLPPCPRCGSLAVETLSHFGSTACKSLMRCTHCAEPFDFFKPI